MKKILLYTSFALAFLLVTFFGLGPVIFADGSNTERLITFIVVIIIYVILFLSLSRFLKSNKK